MSKITRVLNEQARMNTMIKKDKLEECARGCGKMTRLKSQFHGEDKPKPTCKECDDMEAQQNTEEEAEMMSEEHKPAEQKPSLSLSAERETLGKEKYRYLQHGIVLDNYRKNEVCLLHSRQLEKNGDCFECLGLSPKRLMDAIDNYDALQKSVSPAEATEDKEKAIRRHLFMHKLARLAYWPDVDVKAGQDTILGDGVVSGMEDLIVTFQEGELYEGRAHVKREVMRAIEARKPASPDGLALEAARAEGYQEAYEEKHQFETRQAVENAMRRSGLSKLSNAELLLLELGEELDEDEMPKIVKRLCRQTLSQKAHDEIDRRNISLSQLDAELEELKGIAAKNEEVKAARYPNTKRPDAERKV